MVEGIDIDAVLNEVKHVQASLSVMSNSIDATLSDDNNYLELQALIFHVKKITEMNLETIDRLITSLRESGAKDYDFSDNFCETAEVPA